MIIICSVYALLSYLRLQRGVLSCGDGDAEVAPTDAAEQSQRRQFTGTGHQRACYVTMMGNITRDGRGAYPKMWMLM